MPENSTINVNNTDYKVWTSKVLIVGTGAASLNAAVQLYDRGVKDILIVTEKYGGGTSNNSGSDKQTYYKLSVEGAGGDSPVAMAKDLAGGCMHGDIALIEATLSSQCFFNLAAIGVPFPHNKFGGYVGYKTDHDLAGRATSAGPRTSNQMFACLSRQVESRNIKIIDNHLLVSILKDNEDKVCGASAIDRKTDEVQLGSIGVALEAGATAQNLTEAQFGIASTKFRWNLSGTYQQVVPKYYSEDSSGRHDFLSPVFGSVKNTADAVFLKGYQWPFDPKKIQNMGSSLVDLLVYRETEEMGRKVYMDFLENISDSFTIDDCGEESGTYLKNSNANQRLPIERLKHMNELAIQLYLDNDIDLNKEPLEIAVCAQHTNGGLTGDIWWQNSLKGLFPVGEVNGSHGVYRPGGSALNAGQAGSLRASQKVAADNINPLTISEFENASNNQITSLLDKVKLFSANFADGVRKDIQTRMTKSAGHIRSAEGVSKAKVEAEYLLRTLQQSGSAGTSLTDSFENYHLALASAAYLNAIEEYISSGGGSRGSYLILDKDGESLHDALPSEWKMKPDNGELAKSICEVKYDGKDFKTPRVPVREIPEETFWFENIWSDYRSGKVFE
ncbi:MAG: FAD-binding protein [Planctomycetota bacterium]|jgi:succinate dehydrogenase/fumarate reductase flavoprotein subunit